MKNTTSSNENIEKNGKQKGIPFVEEANLRDYFAAKAMQAIVDVGHNPELFANHAYKIADEMLRAREAS